MTLIPLAIVLVRVTAGDLYLFQACIEPNVCDLKVSKVVATEDECVREIKRDWGRRVRIAQESGYDIDAVMGTLTMCGRLMDGFWHVACHQMETDGIPLHRLTGCPKLPTVPGYTPSTITLAGPRDRVDGRGVSVLGRTP